MTGGFGDNEYLRSCLENDLGSTVRLVQPEGASSKGSRAVCLGACLHAMQNAIASRINMDWIGIDCHREATPEEQLARETYFHNGTQHIEVFFPIKKKAEMVTAEEYIQRWFNYDYPKRLRKKEVGQIKLFRSVADACPAYTDDTDLTTIGKMFFNITPSMKSEPVQLPTGEKRQMCEYC
jgi:hypothetical protein